MKPKTKVFLFRLVTITLSFFGFWFFLLLAFWHFGEPGDRMGLMYLALGMKGGIVIIPFVAYIDHRLMSNRLFKNWKKSTLVFSTFLAVSLYLPALILILVFFSPS